MGPDEDKNFTADPLELALSPEETARAELPNELDNLSSDATHLLTEAPTQAGAMVESAPLMEPILMASLGTADQREVEAPPFFQRLGLDQGTARVKRESLRVFSLAVGENWPVFFLRVGWLGPAPAPDLKSLAAITRKYGGDRVCLGPHNELDVFFNDRKSLERAKAQAALPVPLDSPIRLLACPGLFSCPDAAMDTITFAESFRAQVESRSWPPLGEIEPLIVSVAGCAAGQGPFCGLIEHADLVFQGRRLTYPVIDQDLAALSPKISHLVAGCPKGALTRSPKPGLTLTLEASRCDRCGFCVHEDVALSWPRPQKGYFRLLLSGRRSGATPVYLPPKVVWDPWPLDWEMAREKLFELIAAYFLTAKAPEPFLAFLERTNNFSLLAQAGALKASPEPDESPDQEPG